MRGAEVNRKFFFRKQVFAFEEIINIFTKTIILSEVCMKLGVCNAGGIHSVIIILCFSHFHLIFQPFDLQESALLFFIPFKP